MPVPGASPFGAAGQASAQIGTGSLALAGVGRSPHLGAYPNPATAREFLLRQQLAQMTQQAESAMGCAQSMAEVARSQEAQSTMELGESWAHG